MGRWLGDFLTENTPSKLRPAEDRLLSACANGYSYNANGSDIRAPFLRFLVLGGDDAAPIHEAGVELYSAVIDGELDLRGSKCVSRLILAKCTIEGPLVIEDASLGTLVLNGSHVRGIKGHRSRIAGSVLLDDGFVSEKAVSLYGAKIDGSLQAGGATISPDEPGKDALVCTAATIKGNVSLTKSTIFGRVYFNYAEIGVDLDLGGTKCHNTPNEPKLDPALCFDGANIGGKISLIDASIEGWLSGANAVIKGDLKCNRLAITGGAFSLNGTSIGKDFTCSAARFSNKKGNALVLDSAGIANNLFLTYEIRSDGTVDRFEADGAVSLYGATVGLNIVCSGGRFDNAESYALTLDAAKIQGAVFLNQAYNEVTNVALSRFEANGAVSLNGADVGADFVCSGGSFSNAGADALTCTNAKIRGNVSLTQFYGVNGSVLGARFEATGSVNLYAVDIGGNLQCHGGRFDNATSYALSLDAAKIQGGVFLSQVYDGLTNAALVRFEALGAVSLDGVDVGGDIECSGGSFSNAAADALSCRNAKVRGSVSLGQLYDLGKQVAGARFEATGSVNLYGADIGGNLQCQGGRFEAPNVTSPAISGEALVVRGCIFFNGPNRADAERLPDLLLPFSSRGEIVLSAARIGLELNCLGGQFSNRTRRETSIANYALNLNGVIVERALLLGGLSRAGDEVPPTIEGSINLAGAKVQSISDRGFVGEEGPDERFFPKVVQDEHHDRLTCHIVLDGLVYETLNADACAGARARKAWLKRQPKKDLSTNFRHQPFDHLVEVLDAMGQDEAARDIAICKQRLLTRRVLSRSGTRNPLKVLGQAWQLLWRPLFDLFVCYGYRPARGLAFAFAIAVFTGSFYQQAAQNGVMVSHDAKGGTGDAKPCADFHPFVYSFDVMLPVVNFGEKDACRASSRGFQLQLPLGLPTVGIAENVTQYVVWFETCFGYLAGGILLAVASGLIKKTQ